MLFFGNSVNIDHAEIDYIGSNLVDFIGPNLVDFYKIGNVEIDHAKNRLYWDPQVICLVLRSGRAFFVLALRLTPCSVQDAAP